MNFIAPRRSDNLMVFRARDDMAGTTDYVRELDHGIDGNPDARSNILRHSLVKMSLRNPLVVLKRWLDLMLGGCHVDLADRDDPGEIAGLIKIPDARSSVPREVVAQAIVSSAPLFHGPLRWKAVIRLLPEGWRDQHGRLRKENVPSRRLFEEFHFEAAEVNVCRYQGTYRDAHLKDSLEPDGTYRTLTLRSTLRSLRAAFDYLANLGRPSGGG